MVLARRLGRIAIDGLLLRLHRDLAFCRDLAHEHDGLPHDRWHAVGRPCPGFDGATGYSPRDGVVRTLGAAGEHELDRAGLADGARKPLRASLPAMVMMFTSGWPNCASGAARISAISASSHPPPSCSCRAGPRLTVRSCPRSAKITFAPWKIVACDRAWHCCTASTSESPPL